MTCKWFQVCPMKWAYDAGRLDKHWIDEYCKGNNLKCIRYQLEETGRYHEDWMLPDGTLDDSLKY